MFLVPPPIVKISHINPRFKCWPNKSCDWIQFSSHQITTFLKPQISIKITPNYESASFFFSKSEPPTYKQQYADSSCKFHNATALTLECPSELNYSIWLLHNRSMNYSIPWCNKRVQLKQTKGRLNGIYFAKMP